MNFSSIPYAIKTSIQDVGTGVFTLGYPMSNILGEEIKVTDGIISLDRSIPINKDINSISPIYNVEICCDNTIF